MWELVPYVATFMATGVSGFFLVFYLKPSMVVQGLLR